MIPALILMLSSGPYESLVMIVGPAASLQKLVIAA